MKPLKIFSDFPLTDSARKLLDAGVGENQIVYPLNPAASVLAKSDSDPGLLDADVAFGQPDTAEVLRSTRLRWLHLSSAGYTRYDTEDFRLAVQARGLVVTNSSTVYAEPCAEHVFAFMLANARGLPSALQIQCDNSSPQWARLRQAGVTPRHQNVVLLGFGAIAVKLIELLRPFAMQIVALRRQPKGDENIPIITLKALPEALAAADHVVNLLPANANTNRFVSRDRLACMKPGAVFYNVGRGTTVDQDALLQALQSGRLSAAWLDVTDPEPLPPGHPLLTAPNCFITPHIAGGHHNESEMLVRHFLHNLRFFRTEAPLADRIM